MYKRILFLRKVLLYFEHCVLLLLMLFDIIATNLYFQTFDDHRYYKSQTLRDEDVSALWVDFDNLDTNTITHETLSNSHRTAAVSVTQRHLVSHHRELVKLCNCNLFSCIL